MSKQLASFLKSQLGFCTNKTLEHSGIEFTLTIVFYEGEITDRRCYMTEPVIVLMDITSESESVDRVKI